MSANRVVAGTQNKAFKKARQLFEPQCHSVVNRDGFQYKTVQCVGLIDTNDYHIVRLHFQCQTTQRVRLSAPTRIVLTRMARRFFELGRFHESRVAFWILENQL